MASGNTLAVFGAFGAFPPTSNYGTLNTRNLVPILDFDDTTQETSYFLLFMPRNYSAGGVTVYLTWAAATATTGTIGWDLAFARLNEGNQDLDTYAFATAQAITAATVPGASGVLKTTSVNISDGTSMNGVGAGEWFILRVRRDVGNDDAAGDAELLGGEIKEQ